MKRLMIIMLMLTICSNAMAGLSGDDFDVIVDDIRGFWDYLSGDDESLRDRYIEEYNSSSEADPYYLESDIPDAAVLSTDQLNQGQVGSTSSSTRVATNPEPCSIILSSIGLGVVGYLKRRRAI